MKYVIDLLQTSLVIYLSFLWIYKPKKQFKIGYPLIVVALCIVLFYVNYDRLVATVISFIANIILPVILTRLNVFKSAYICLTNIGLISYLNSLFDMCFGIFYEKQFENILSYAAINIFITVIILISVRIGATSPYIKSFVSSSRILRIIVLATIWTFFVLSTSASILIEINMKIGYSFAALNLILLCIAIVFFMYLVANYKKKELDKKTIATLENNMKQQIKYYEEKYKLYEDLRRFKHDSANIRIGLLNFLDNNNIEGAKNYLSRLSQETNNNCINLNTGSPVLDALISDKQQEAYKNNTTITFDGILPYDALETLDLCVLFGNALDNAIEACANIPVEIKKEINISVIQNRNLLMVNITNPVANKIIIKNNSIRSTKKDGVNHGIGIYSIKNTVKKYNGYCELKYNNYTFTIDLGFFIPQQEKEAM